MTLKEQLKENGYLHLKNFFDKLDVEEIYLDARQVFLLQMKAKGYDLSVDFNENLFDFFKDHQQTFINCGKHIQHLISLHKISVSSKITNLLREVGFQFPNICTRPVLFFNSPSLATKSIYHTTPAHQDQASMQGSENSVVLWFPLVDVNKELGALQIIPKSHKDGLVIKDYDSGFGLVSDRKDEDFIDVEVERGDALLFSSYLIHRSGNNTSGDIRWSAHFRYNDLEDKDFIDRNYPHPYIYKPISKDNS